MKHRAVTRFAAAAGVVLSVPLAVAVPAAPAVAHDADAPPGVSALAREEDESYLALTFPTRGCDGIEGGPLPGVDGWVFEEPVTGAIVKVYSFLFATNQNEVVELRIDASGVRAVDVTDTRSMVEDVQKKPVTTTAGQTAADILVLPLPPGVTGGLIPDGGAWLRTPPGWRLVDGALNHGNVYDSPAEFALEQACVVGPPPPPAPVTTAPSSAVVAAPAGGSAARDAGGITGRLVAVLGGVGALTAGAAALAARRRRKAAGTGD